MKDSESVIEILNYVFQQCADDASDDKFLSEAHEKIVEDLRSKGVSEESIGQAFLWLARLDRKQYFTGVAVNSNSMRMFDEKEISKLGVSGCGFVMSLEVSGILDAKAREILITQLMLLPQATCHLTEIKWVVLLVLLNCTKQIDTALLRSITLLAHSGTIC